MMHDHEPRMLVSPEDRQFWMERRRALLTELRAIERRLCIPPSVPTHTERDALRMQQKRGGEGEG